MEILVKEKETHRANLNLYGLNHPLFPLNKVCCGVAHRLGPEWVWLPRGSMTLIQSKLRLLRCS